jgi:hypothetical protein
MSHQCADIIPANADLLQKYGMADRGEMDAIAALVRNAYAYGNDTVKNGLTTMFHGMENAVSVYADMKKEVHTLHDGILFMKQEAQEMKEQLTLAETLARQKAEVRRQNLLFFCALNVD